MSSIKLTKAPIEEMPFAIENRASISFAVDKKYFLKSAWTKLLRIALKQMKESGFTIPKVYSREICIDKDGFVTVTIIWIEEESD